MVYLLTLFFYFKLNTILTFTCILTPCCWFLLTYKLCSFKFHTVVRVTSILVVAFVITFVIARTFIEVVANKRLNGISVIAIWVMISPFAGKEVETLSALDIARVRVESPRNHAAVCYKSVICPAPNLICRKKLLGWNECLITRPWSVE